MRVLLALALALAGVTAVPASWVEHATATEYGRRTAGAATLSDVSGERWETLAPFDVEPCASYHRSATEGAAGGDLVTLGKELAPTNNCEVTALTVSDSDLGRAETCALLSSGDVDCWGTNKAGELGDGTHTGPEQCGEFGACSRTPVVVSGIHDATAISAGSDHTCALLFTGGVDCWGSIEEGQLSGEGKRAPEQCGAENEPCISEPVAVGGISNAVAIATGANTCALLATGGVDCWGFDRLRELESPEHGHEHCRGITLCVEPAAVAGISDATAISASEADTCALLSTGVVECWGGDEHGELGDGRFEDVGGPVIVAGITNATAVSVGWDTCALLSTGEADCWGDNRYGQLGNGTNSGPEACSGPGQREAVACSSVPVAVGDLHHATAIAAGAGQTCAILRTGGVDCWGSNYGGSLGDGATSGPETCEGERRFEPGEPPRRPTFPCSRFPVPVSHLAHATVIAAGLNGTCAILATRSVDCWGQLGYLPRNDTKEGTDLPVPIDGFE